ncbi:hypothetical protein [Sphingomonas sp.]|uniref:hypothetical protein n=1 Tax=Sphingomonas sp. TaxID=28214 RepID=UPI001D7336F7|nr:hypothetical protein [Sphingomonas sp.]MBX9797714.1 hypothetical protein [Sphingomonas sp.]
MRSLFAFMLVASAAPALAQENPPAPPAGASTRQVVPPHHPDGSYATPSHAVTGAEAIWHLRSALNVAALGCRDADDARTAGDYNAMLARHAQPLAAANAAVTQRYRQQAGARWETMRERAMTQLYNFYAQVPAHDEFCATAKAVLAEVQGVAAADLASFARARLDALEAPFTRFYARYEAWQADMAQWQGQRGGGAMVPTVVASR